MTTVGIVGPGRAGVGLGVAFLEAGLTVRLHGRHRRQVRAALEVSWGGDPPWVGDVQAILLAVPDHAITEVAGRLADAGGVRDDHTVLHLCGALDRGALSPLESSGAALGSFHPLQALSDPSTAPERLRGAVAAVEGDPRAIEAASELARRVGLVPVSVPPSTKVKGHAGAVFASNYVVTLAATARDLLVEAGLPASLAWDAALALVRGAVENLAAAGPEAALTGPVARGDVETIRRHAAALDAETARLYGALARATARLVGSGNMRLPDLEDALGVTEDSRP